MQSRINGLHQKASGAFKALYHIGAYLSKSTIEQALLDLIYFRVSQINGCAYCLDMHSKDLRAMGETEQRLHLLSAWRETALYTEREKAALAWAEAVTELNDREVPDEVFEIAKQQFNDLELIDLTLGVIAINSYNRVNISFKVQAGSYQPATADAPAQW